MAYGQTDSGGAAGERPSSDRVPPNDVQAEKAVLSAILLDNDVHPRDRSASSQCRRLLRPGASAVFFEAMIDAEGRKPAGRPDHPLGLPQVSRPARLDRRRRSCSQRSPTTRRPPRTSRTTREIVRDKSIKRSVIRTASEIVGHRLRPDAALGQLLDAAESKIFALSQEKASRSTPEPAQGRDAQGGRSHRHADEPKWRAHRPLDGLCGRWTR